MIATLEKISDNGEIGAGDSAAPSALRPGMKEARSLVARTPRSTAPSQSVDYRDTRDQVYPTPGHQVVPATISPNEGGREVEKKQKKDAVVGPLQQLLQRDPPAQHLEPAVVPVLLGSAPNGPGVHLDGEPAAVEVHLEGEEITDHPVALHIIAPPAS